VLPEVAAWKVRATGEPYDLRIGERALSFCDDRGRHGVELRTGTETPATEWCPKKSEGNGDCSGLPMEVTVETPNLGPRDIIFVEAWAFHPEGRVHDCAADGKVLVVATIASVERYDLDKGTSTIVDDKEGGERVAIGHGWMAWSEFKGAVHAQRL
jgi:hypothetical protein